MNAVLVPGFNPGPYTGDGTNTWLLPGADPVLIDAAAGDPRHIEALAAALEARCPPPAERQPLRVLVTHAHGDHLGGCDAIAARWPDARFYKMPWPDRDAQSGVRFLPLGDGERVAVAGVRLCAVHTPGHAPDHLCLAHETSRLVFVGDLLVGGGGTPVIPASAGGSMAAYLASLRRVRDLHPERLMPAHGPPIDDPAAIIEEYLRHRAAREAEVLAAVAAGVRTPGAIVSRAYPELAPALARAAAESVLSHLIKLRDEGHVTEKDGEWTVPGF